MGSRYWPRVTRRSGQPWPVATAVNFAVQGGCRIQPVTVRILILVSIIVRMHTLEEYSLATVPVTPLNVHRTLWL